jgi:hypothetical protein
MTHLDQEAAAPFLEVVGRCWRHVVRRLAQVGAVREDAVHGLAGACGTCCWRDERDEVHAGGGSGPPVPVRVGRPGERESMVFKSSRSETAVPFGRSRLSPVHVRRRHEKTQTCLAAGQGPKWTLDS